MPRGDDNGGMSRFPVVGVASTPPLFSHAQAHSTNCVYVMGGRHPQLLAPVVLKGPLEEISLDVYPYANKTQNSKLWATIDADTREEEPSIFAGVSSLRGAFWGKPLLSWGGAVAPSSPASA